MKAPSLMKGGKFVLAYDVGGTQLYVVDEQGQVMFLEVDENEPLIAANLNDNGWLAVTTEKKNYKSRVSVYNTQQELVFDFNSSRRFVIDACVIGNGERLAAVTLGQEESIFVSNVVLYDLGQTEPVANYNIVDALPIAVKAKEKQILIVTDTSLSCAKPNGTILSTYLYNGAYLREYDLSGNGFTVLLLNRYQSGSVGRLVTVGSDGEEIASLDVNEEILDVSAMGRYLAVLYTERLVVYNQHLQVYASLTGTDHARAVRMRSDGSVLLLASGEASLFLP